jgi:hypothetical protein
MAEEKNMIKRFGIGLVMLLAAWPVIGGRGPCAAARTETAVFFSQGQAAFNPQNVLQSQQAAIQDFLGQAVTQALASFLSPSQMGGKYSTLQEKVLKKPERYVQNYQIQSESPMEGLYRVVGQVTVFVELLKKDAEQYGLVAEASQSPQALPVSPEPGRDTETKAVGAAEARPPAEQRPKEERNVLWAVAENWDGIWQFPRDRVDPQPPLAAVVIEEARGHSWGLRLAAADTLEPDATGEVELQQAAATAKRMGAQVLILGTAVAEPEGDRGVVLDATARVVNAASGKVEGEIHKRLGPNRDGRPELAKQLATVILPQLDRLLRGSGVASDSTYQAGAADEWALLIHSDHPYAHWEEMEKILRESFKSMKVKGIEMGPQQAVVRLEGVGPDFVSVLQGVELRGGVQAEIGRFSAEARSVEMTLFAQ